MLVISESTADEKEASNYLQLPLPSSS